MKRKPYAVTGGAGRPSVFISDGMEVDVTIKARVKVLDIDGEHEIVRLLFLDATRRYNGEGEWLEVVDGCDAWVKTSSLYESKPITARLEMYDSYLVRLRDLVIASQPDETKRTNDDRHILKLIDDAIGPDWIRKRQETKP